MRSYGYEPDGHTVREAEAQMIRGAAARILAGESLRSIVQTLNADGIVTVTGKSWQPITLRRLLLSPRVGGKRKNRAGRVVKADWPAIVDDVTFKRVTEVLSDPSRKIGGPPSSRVYLLTGGLVRCGICEAPLIARPAAKGRRGYVCSSAPPTRGCGRVRCKADPLEDHVVAHVLARLASPRSAAKLERLLSGLESDSTAARRQMARDEKRLDELAVDYSASRITRREWLAARRELTSRIAAAKALMERSDKRPWPARVRPEQLVEWWGEATLDQKRALLDVLIEAVYVGPATRPGSRIFEPERVRIVWR